ncbi:MAG TPA: S4 domain-containing protein, partial [Candidatus Acidoferrales bacterium]|nr:S4 domain-containing protein [Candidatus Acidoferrales bacterium]
MEERLQKIIARAGIASRRHAEELIRAGAVTVNGRVITELGTKADAEKDHITVGPRVVRAQEQAPPL